MKLLADMDNEEKNCLMDSFAETIVRQLPEDSGVIVVIGSDKTGDTLVVSTLSDKDQIGILRELADKLEAEMIESN